MLICKNFSCETEEVSLLYTKSTPFWMLPLSSDLSASKFLASSSLNLPRGRYSCKAMFTGLLLDEVTGLWVWCSM